jgi:fatty-acyl-CoA synthase
VAGVRDLSDVEALEAKPLAERGLPVNSFRMIEAGARIAPAAPALSFFLSIEAHARPHTLSYAALLARVIQTANLFRRLGVKRGDVVAYLLPNLPETHLAIWGGETAGVAFAVNPQLETEALATLFKAAKVKVLVTLAPTPGTDLWDKAAEAARAAPSLETILTVNMAPYADAARGLLLKLRGATAPRRIGRIRVADFMRSVSRQRADRLEFPEPDSEDIASYFCTGGTTGLPKIARRTHRCEVFDAWAMSAFTQGFSTGRTIFAGLPLFHVNGQLVTGLAAFSTGAHVLIGTPQGYRGAGVLQRFWELVETHRLDGFSGVPTVYSTLLRTPVEGRDISSLKLALCGAAPLPVQLFESFKALTGIEILEGYGLTEGGCTSSVNPPGGEKRVGSVGLRLPYQQMRALILDQEGRHERDANVDEIGVLAICGPNLFEGYLDRRHDERLWIDRHGQRWLNTGDLARQDRDGYFWLTGRRKELIIRGGHNIDPKQIEEALARHPAVALAAAVGRPDAHAGEVPVAYVELKPGRAADPEELAAFAAEHIAERPAHPKSIIVIDQLPLTAVGKIFKPALAAREIEGVIRGLAKDLGVRLTGLVVAPDATRGLLARFDCDAPADLEAALGAYAFAWQRGAEQTPPAVLETAR